MKRVMLGEKKTHNFFNKCWKKLLALKLLQRINEH